MGRPPVTNLYSTFLFVAWVAVLIGWVVELKQKHGLGLMSATFGGFVLLLASHRFGITGDTMQQVVAVLDSNMWLTVHVLTIMIGYAGCLMAGLVGHVYLIQGVRSGATDEAKQSTYRTMIALLGFGLTFTFLGTMLGGVWADQSWGRFWGWDPKENGALLIILWTAMLFHAKPAGLIKEWGMAAGSVLGVGIVVLAWLGVNLLGVGLHSYGWTSGVAAGVFGILLAEIVFVVVLTILSRRALQSAS